MNALENYFDLSKPRNNVQLETRPTRPISRGDIFSRLNMKTGHSDLNQNIIEISLSIEDNFDKSFMSAYRIDHKDIDFLEQIQENFQNKGRIIAKSMYKSSIQVATKSFTFSAESLGDFHNEILIHKKINESNKKEYFSELLGFVLGYEEYHPYFGTIVLKWYNMPDLITFSYIIDHGQYDIEKSDEYQSESETIEMIMNHIKVFEANFNEEMDVFLDIAHQIAKGFLEVFFFFLLEYTINPLLL